MVLGRWSRENTLYGRDGYSVVSNGDLALQLEAAILRLPELATTQAVAIEAEPARVVTPPPERHLGESSLFIGADKVIRQIVDGKPEPVVYGGVLQKANGTPQGRKLGSLIELKELSRRVLQSQNEGWPHDGREEERRKLRRRMTDSWPPTARSTKPPSPRPRTEASSAACPTS